MKKTTTASPLRFPSFKELLLFFVSTFAIITVFSFGENKSMLDDRITPYWDDFKDQVNETDLETRKTNRYGVDYLFPKQVASFFEKKGNTANVLLLMPNTSYFKQQNLEIHVVEPSIFYYFTGLKTVWPYNKKAINANWVLTVDKGRLIFDSVTSKAMLMEKIDSLKKYPVTL